jgi:hypothetical protein
MGPDMWAGGRPGAAAARAAEGQGPGGRAAKSRKIGEASLRLYVLCAGGIGAPGGPSPRCREDSNITAKTYNKNI